MPNLRGPGSPRSSAHLVAAMLGMVVLPAALTLHTVRVSSVVNVAALNPSPHGYTVSLLLFLVPICFIGLWLVPREGVRISKKSFLWTIAILFPAGAMLDFFFAHLFLTFPDRNATLGITAPALGGGVPIEEYIFYLTGFAAVLLMYLWFDEYWLAAYSVHRDDPRRSGFQRLIGFHPESLMLAIALIAAGIVLRHHFAPNSPGFPGYFTFLAAGALGPSTALFPAALPVVNWRAFSLTLFIILLTSLLWEATLGVPYGWWGFQPAQMIGIDITAWDHLPIEEIFVWIAVTYQTVIVYEVVKQWQASGRKARHAFLGWPAMPLQQTSRPVE